MKKSLFLLLVPIVAKAEIVSALVVGVTPVYNNRTVNIPMEVCEQVQSNNKAGAVLGAIAGAAIGNQFGNGSGKDVATVVGGVLGAQVGGQGVVTENRCRTVNRSYTERGGVVGYDVTYKFMGNNYTVRMSERPGTTLRLNVYHTVE